MNTLRRLLWWVISPLWLVSGLALIYVMGEGATLAALLVFGVSSVMGVFTVIGVVEEGWREREHELALERLRGDLYDKPLLP